VVDQFYPFTKSQQVTDAAIKAIKRSKFRLMFIHLPDPDSAGHDYSFESKQYLQTVKRHDRMLQQILNALIEKGIYSSSLIIIGSDHAGEGTGHGDYNDLDRWFPFVMVGPCVKNGFDIHNNVRQVNIMDFTPTILYSMGFPLPENLDGTPLYQAFSIE
jgi:predicted AlkP superfamily pyrophosphatase or phosphodiesterase